MKVVRKNELKHEERKNYLRAIASRVEILNTDKVAGVLHVIVPKGRKSDRHYHSTFKEIFIPLTKGIIEIDGEEFEVDSGDVIIVNEKEVHSAKATKDNDFELFAIKLPEDESDRTSVDKG